jgi:small GTP-binding protein
MIKKKICMLGAFAVGKTSLVQRFVNSIFSEKYQTTIGVKIDQKMVKINDREINLMLWDIHGEDNFQKVKPSYIMGSAGYFIVVDVTRGDTLEVGMSLQKMADKMSNGAPYLVLFNKTDLDKEEWDISDSVINDLKNSGVNVILTSANEGTGVEEAFTGLTEMMINN